MVKLSLYASLLLLCTSGAMMAMVAGDTCKEDIGACDGDCNSRCSSAHQGGSGVCMVIGDANDCWCYYECPALKTCEVTLGDFGSCDDTQCDIDCAAKYPGKGASGFCLRVGDPQYDSCHCRYFCS